MVQALPKEFVQEIKKQFVEEIKKDLAAELKKELVQVRGPSCAGSVDRREPTLSTQRRFRHHVDDCRYWQTDAQIGEPLKSRHRTALCPMRSVRKKDHSGRGGCGDHEHNESCKSLTVQQAKRLFNGEYSYWSQVGGPDLPVKVVTYLNNTLEIEDLMKASVAPDAAQLRYASLLVPAVDRIKGP